MALIWVIGSGGLLGKALVSELSQSSDALFDPIIKFSWNDPALASQQLKKAVSQFSSQAKSGLWKIYWAAGIGTMHSTEEDLQEETKILDALISNLLNDSNLNLNLGTFIFASSAGAIYAGSADGVITESTAPSPINAYGRTKLLQESLINQINRDGHGATIIVGRITTLYGFKTKDGKQQGLIAEMLRRTMLNQVVHIYVPLDTMRDYITAREAAMQLINVENDFQKTPGIHLKIIASGISTSVAQILATLKHISKRNLRVVTQSDNRSTQYQRIAQFNSIVKSQGSSNLHHNKISLAEGLSELWAEIQQDISKFGSKF